MARIKSKAAQETARRKAERVVEDESPLQTAPSGVPASEPERRGGVLSGMRTGFKSVTGSKKGKKNKVIDTLLWIAVVAGAIFFFARRL